MAWTEIVSWKNEVSCLGADEAGARGRTAEGSLMINSAKPVRVLLVMRTRTYRAKAFLKAAARVGVTVTVATEREQPLARLARGASIALDFGDPRQAAAQVTEFAAEYPLGAVVGVDDDTTVLAAQLARALGLPHNRVEAVKAARYKDVMRLALGEAQGVLS